MGPVFQRPGLFEVDSITSRQFHQVLAADRGRFSGSRSTFRSCDCRCVNEILETCRRENKQQRAKLVGAAISTMRLRVSSVSLFDFLILEPGSWAGPKWAQFKK